MGGGVQMPREQSHGCSFLRQFSSMAEIVFVNLCAIMNVVL